MAFSSTSGGLSISAKPRLFWYSGNNIKQGDFVHQRLNIPASLKALPKGVVGTYMLDLCLWRLKIKRPNAALHRMKNTHQHYHFIVTQKNEKVYTLYLLAELHQNKMRILRKLDLAIAPRFDFRISIWKWLRKMVSPLQAKGCTGVYCELTGTNAQAKKSALIDSLYSLFGGEFCLPGENEVIRTTIVDEVPSYVAPTVEVGRSVRKALSKEEWLKQHYPELTELPKWRFPGMVAA
jgi:hypothetical protein